jgi:hypothetical protein
MLKERWPRAQAKSVVRSAVEAQQIYIIGKCKFMMESKILN